MINRVIFDKGFSATHSLLLLWQVLKSREKVMKDLEIFVGRIKALDLGSGQV